MILGGKPMPRQMNAIEFGVGYVHDISHSSDREGLVSGAVTLVLYCTNNWTALHEMIKQCDNKVMVTLVVMVRPVYLVCSLYCSSSVHTTLLQSRAVGDAMLSVQSNWKEKTASFINKKRIVELKDRISQSNYRIESVSQTTWCSVKETSATRSCWIGSSQWSTLLLTKLLIFFFTSSVADSSLQQNRLAINIYLFPLLSVQCRRLVLTRKLIILLWIRKLNIRYASSEE